MQRIYIAGLVCLSWLIPPVSHAAGDEKVAPSVTLVPDENYQPTNGDVVRLYRRESGELKPVHLAMDLYGFQELQKHASSRDEVGLRDLADKGGTVSVDSGTPVRVITTSTDGITPAITRRSAGGPTVTLRPAIQDPVSRYYTVRIIDGDQKDKLFYVDKVFVKRCAEVITKAAKKKAAANVAKAAPAPDRALSILKIGDSLDRQGKTDGAIASYRQVVKDFPDSPHAKTAAARIKELTKP